MRPIEPADLAALWREPAASDAVSKWADKVVEPTGLNEPYVKWFPDEQYHNYYGCGFSLTFIQPPGSTFQNASREFNKVDIINPLPPPAKPTRRNLKDEDYLGEPALPITFHFPSASITVPSDKPDGPSRQHTRPLRLDVTKETTGKDFVECFGEPTRKNQGRMMGALGMGCWMEWEGVELRHAPKASIAGTEEGNESEQGDTVIIGVMVELRDPGPNQKLTPEQEKHGAGGMWDRAATWEWQCLKLFDPGVKPGKRQEYPK